jgi:hypothetical protein
MRAPFDKLALLRTINRRVTRWGNILLRSRVAAIFTSAPPAAWAVGLPVLQPGPGQLVESMGPELAVAVLSQNATSPPTLLVLDMRTGAASSGVRPVPLSLNASVAATIPIEGDCSTMGLAGAFCNKGWRGPTLPAVFRLPGGAAQLLGLVMMS